MRNVILMQPVTPGRQLNYPQMEVNAIRKLSSVSAIVGVLSIAIQVLNLNIIGFNYRMLPMKKMIILLFEGGRVIDQRFVVETLH